MGVVVRGQSQKTLERRRWTMRLLACALASLPLLLGSSAPSLGNCGKDPADLAAVAATEATAAAECDCCTAATAREQRVCVRGVAKAAVNSGALSKSCAGRVVRESA